MKLGRITLAIVISLVLTALLSPAVQADDSKAEVELKVEIVSPLSVITSKARGVGTRRATLNGSLTSLGTASPVAVSFGWDTKSHAENAAGYANWTTPSEVKTGTGAFKVRVADLTRGTTYYFRAKAEGDGTSYGEEMSFTTNPRGRWWKWLGWFFPWLAE